MEQDPDPGVASEALQRRQREVSHHWPSERRDSLQLDSTEETCRTPAQPARLPKGGKCAGKEDGKLHS